MDSAKRLSLKVTRIEKKKIDNYTADMFSVPGEIRLSLSSVFDHCKTPIDGEMLDFAC
jgi:hypothetical protein